jgi:plastocyanin domain-containing protein
MNIKYILVLAFCFALFASANAQTHKNSKLQTARVLITENGYSRTSINLRRGVPARITFLRKTDVTCATEVVISAYGIHRTLPLNTAVAINFTPKRSGEFSFTCGMNMMRGKLIVQ